MWCMTEFTIKVHDVLHEREDFDVSHVESYIEEWIVDVDDEVVGVRVASGDMNSPLFVTVERNSVSVEYVKEVARDALRGFENFVEFSSSLDVMVRDKNLRVSVE